MKKIVLIVAFIITLGSCKTDIKKSEEINQTIELVVTETPILALGEFDIKASEFVNKKVEVQGIVDHICKHGGKKILLVSDEGTVHVTSNERFNEKLKGSEIILSGIVIEEKIDEAYCLKMEEDNIKSHSEGTSNKAQFESKKNHIQQYRNKMKVENIDHISNYSLLYVSHTEME